MSPNTLRRSTKYLWGLTLRESIVAAIFGALVAVSKLAVRIPLHIPGHSGLVWMTVLTVCCLTFKQGRAGTLAGTVAGVLAVALGLGNEGVFTFFKYFLPGISMDLMFAILPVAARKWYLAGAVAALAHFTKLLVNYFAGLLLHLPMGFIVFGIKVAAVNHLGFGFGAGILAWIICNKTGYRKYITGR